MQRSSVRKNQAASHTRLYYLDESERKNGKANARESRKKKILRQAKKIQEDIGAAAKSSKNNYDVTLIAVIFILVFFGLIMVFSASAPSALAYEGNQYHFITMQGICAILGFAAMFVCAKIDYHFYSKWAFYILLGSLLILFAVYIPKVGMVVNNARRWIKIGFSMQPSEITKIGVIIFFSYSLSLVKDKIKKFWSGMMMYLVILGIFALVLMKQPHFSCTVVLCLSCVVIMFVAGAKLWHFGILAVIAGIAGAILILKEPYRLERVLTFLDPFADTTDAGYQITNSLYAIGSGGLFGLGLGMSRQKLLYLPEPHNDFIFAIVCEELGLLGAIVVVVLFGMLIWRGYRIAQTARDTYGAYLATGITSLIGIQAVLNIAVVTSSVPVTGVALPFFSYGGTSLVIMLASMGILLNISKQCTGLGKNKQ